MRRHAIIRAVPLAVLLVVTLLRPTEAATIATWNLAFNTNNHRSRGVDAILPEIANGIALFEPDVLFLTELESEAALVQLAEILEEDHDLEYQSVFGEHDEHLNLGVLHKPNVVLHHLLTLCDEILHVQPHQEFNLLSRPLPVLD